MMRRPSTANFIKLYLSSLLELKKCYFGTTYIIRSSDKLLLDLFVISSSTRNSTIIIFFYYYMFTCNSISTFYKYLFLLQLFCLLSTKMRIHIFKGRRVP